MFEILRGSGFGVRGSEKAGVGIFHSFPNPEPRTPQEIIEYVEGMNRPEDDPRPFGIKKLKENIYRLRVGNYRVIYEIDEERKIVVVTKVDKRRESTYKRIG